MDRHQLGSQLLQLKAIAIGLYLVLAFWPGFAQTPFEKVLSGIALLLLLLFWSVGTVGYADARGIHYHRLMRRGHILWPEVKRAEWDPEKMVLWLTAGDTVLDFKYRGIAALFGSRQRPEAVNFIEQKLTENSPPVRFVCKTSLTA